MTSDPAQFAARLSARTSELLEAQGAAVLLTSSDGALEVAYDSGTLHRLGAGEIAAVSDCARGAHRGARPVALTLPLCVRRSGAPIAVLALGERRDGRQYTSDVRQVLQRFARDIAPLLLMAQRDHHLLEQVKRMLERESGVTSEVSRG